MKNSLFKIYIVEITGVLIFLLILSIMAFAMQLKTLRDNQERRSNLFMVSYSDYNTVNHMNNITTI